MIHSLILLLIPIYCGFVRADVSTSDAKKNSTLGLKQIPKNIKRAVEIANAAYDLIPDSTHHHYKEEVR